LRTFSSFAKVNLHLEVVGRRPDGYHDLRTIFQTIDLADRIALVPRRAAGVELTIRGASQLPTGPGNLAVRAAESFFAAYPDAGFGGVAIELEKRIPAGGGLGGGSSNAATVLLGLARLAGLDPFSPTVSERLAALGRELGADVPFFLIGGCALGVDRGDRIVPLPDPAPPAGADVLYLVLPPFGLSTAEVFGRLERVGGPAPFDPLARALAGEHVAFAELIGRNDLEEPAFVLSPALGAMYTSLVRGGARRVRMSGSGSSLFALFADAAAAETAVSALPQGVNCLRVSLLGREAWRRAGGFDVPAGGS
jgi:4-diphosphocytidyl-2-C-methyl-D-erythritol kinase